MTESNHLRLGEAGTAESAVRRLSGVVILCTRLWQYNKTQMADISVINISLL